jgi:putative transposase
MDNIFIERLWKTIKYEDIYLKAYSSITDVRKGLKAYFERYNSQRRHQGLGDRTPDEVYLSALPEVKEAV